MIQAIQILNYLGATNSKLYYTNYSINWTPTYKICELVSNDDVKTPHTERGAVPTHMQTKKVSSKIMITKREHILAIKRISELTKWNK